MPDPKISLTAIKISKFASHETTCYEAILVVDGQNAARLSNDGQGGPDNIHPLNKELLKRAEDYCKSLPAEKTEYKNDDGSPMMLTMDLELYVINLIEEHQWRQTVKRKSKTKTLFKLPEDGDHQYREYNRPLSPEMEAFVLEKHPTATVIKPE